MIVVTGASGFIGKGTIEFLLKNLPADQIVGMVRDVNKDKELNNLGIEIREGNYQDYQSLLKAFKGAEKVLLVSAHAFTDLTAQHINVIDAAKQAGVKHIVFTSIYRTESAQHSIPWVTLSMKITEDYLKKSGMAYTILRNTFYFDYLPYYFRDVLKEGKLVIPGGEGAVAFALRSDLAEATANVLAQSGHENKTYALIGNRSYSYGDIAEILSKESGKEILYADTGREDFIQKITETGVPVQQAEFWAEWLQAMKMDDMRGDGSNSLEILLGRAPVTLESFLKEVYFSGKTVQED
ncbi:SDR family oxidoreductase [Flavobacterium psychroterrae]|uniref:SDR family oxidoreductase n=1 Tax=Flavobacterium psychroterrae TaxID=2133767 RepID=A0ABS5PE91_9FLAO|nr:SDR family oxidoreductase [Flavobacterium psychroterrae]MBS7232607.1 SDR family oxidoreductase [Flavobacterium psychroterrae]